MIIKNNNKAVDVQKNQHVCWEGQKTSRRFYVKKTISYGKWSTHKQPETIPSISWEGGTTVNCKCWVERTNKVREGFVISTVTEKHYLIPSFSGIASDCRVNTTGNNEDGFTFTFGRRDNATSDRTYTGVVQYTDESGSYPITVTITQTKRNKYVTKLDNASITTNLIPASGGNISSGTLTFRKTYNTGETENVSEHVTFSTVSATTKGTTESPVTDVKTIQAGGTTQKQTTIDGVTLTHPSFTVKQAANTKTIKTPESKTTTSVILSVNPTVVYSSGGTVTFTLQRKYTLNKVVYQYTSGSTSGGGSDANQGPEAVNANQTYTITGITNVSSTTGTSYKIPSSDTARTIKFKTTYDGITSNEASVSQKLDGPDESKAFIYSNLKITEYSYTKDNSGYHFPASGKTITATDCTLKGTYDWTYTSMENKTVTETVTWTFNDLTAAMYTFTPTSFTADSLGTTSKAADIQYKNFTVDIKNLKHTYNGKQHDVKDSNGRFLTASKTVTLTRQGNSGTQASNPTSTNLSVSVSPTSFDYKGGSATLTATLIKIFNVTWTSGATSTNPTNTDVTSSTTFSGTYREYGQTQQNTFSFTGNKPTIPNIQSSKTSRTYTFTGTYGSYSDTATVSQTGNTTLYTVTFYINNTYAKWSKTTGNESITKKFSKDTPYTELIPDETPTWLEGSNLKYVFLGNYSTTTTGAAVTSGSLLTSDINLYARWSTASTGYVKVSWDPNGGQLSPASGGTSTSNAIYDYHNPGTIRCQPSDIGYKNTPSKTGNTFIGWYYNSTYYTQFPISITLGTTAIQFNAMYTVTEKTVYWNSNGGTFSDGSTQKSEKKNYGASISAYSSSPSKTATTSTIYKFKGWSLTTNGNVVTFPYTLTTTSSTFNFYAIYTSSTNTCTINWNNTNSNIAIWSDNTKGTKTSSANYGTKYSELTAPATLANPIKNDNDTIRYTGAWYTASINGTLLSNSSATVTSNPTNVYLQLTIAGYKVTLNPNNGTLTVSGHAYTSSNPYITYTKGSFNLGSFVPTYTNYNFKGWSTNSSATSGSTSSVTINAAITYYAIWKQIFTVTWNLNGGNIGGVTTNKTESVESGTTVSFSKYTPVRTGYTFKGWSTSSAATSGSTTGNSAAITADTTFYATWKQLFTVTWNLQGGNINGDTTNKTESVESGTTVSFSKYTPVRTGYTFKGWSTSSAATSGSTTGNSAAITADTTFYAIYTISINTYTVTWANTNASIAIWKDNTTQNKTSSVTHGTQYNQLTAPAEFANPIKNSGDTIRYTAAWYTLPDNGVLLSTSTTQVTKDITVYAVLTITGYKVTLNPDNGTLTVSGHAYTSSNPYITYTKGSFNLENYRPTRTDYSFKGWSNSPGGSYVGGSVTINSSIIYYALWQQLFTVTWNLQGGNIGGDTTNKTESVESGTTVSFTKYTPVKTGYTFNGWATSSTATSGSTTGKSAAITADTTFYATWKSATLTPILLILAE